MSRIPKSRFGKAFPDQMSKVRFISGHFKKSKHEGLNWQESLISGYDQIDTSTQVLTSWRRLAFSMIIILTFSLIFFKLFQLQIIYGRDNLSLADSNRILVKVIHAPRGVIYDRNGIILAQNEPGFRFLENDIQSSKAKYISRDEVVKMEVKNDPRIKDLEIDSLRSYPKGKALSQVIGYVSEITKEELESQVEKNNGRVSYKLGDKIGRGAVEQAYEKVLRGIDGGEIIEVDAQGRKIRTLRKTDPIPGQNITLTIDSDLQTNAYNLLENAAKNSGSCCGALVAQDPNTGQILALVSYPSFNPQDISGSLAEPNSPFLNRVIAGTYPPGSTFKIASALAGLESGKITSSTIFEDTGVINLGPFKFSNWYFTQYGRTEGPVDIVKALKRSNDVYFYRLGELIGEGTLADWAKKAGLGKKLGIDIPGEVEGLIPDNNWKVKNFDQVWYPGDTLHMAIGQGFVLSTPLQINNLTSLVAASGKQYPPHLGLKISESSGNIIKEFRYDVANSNLFQEKNIEFVKRGLEEVPKDGGTAWPFFTFPIPTAGKTGTAEFGDLKKTHAWYTGYAPTDEPKIVATVLIEGGGEGSSVASPVVKELFRWYLSGDKNNLIKDTNFVATESARTLGE